jgi:hypothetical protein
MPRIAIDESEGAVNSERHWVTNVLVIAGHTVGFGAPVSIREDAALRKHRRWIFREQDYAGGGSE